MSVKAFELIPVLEREKVLSDKGKTEVSEEVHFDSSLHNTVFFDRCHKQEHLDIVCGRKIKYRCSLKEYQHFG